MHGEQSIEPDSDDDDTMETGVSVGELAVRKHPKEHQEAAIKEVVHRVVDKMAPGAMLVGGTGSGKTLCGSEIMNRIAMGLGCSTRMGGFAVLVVVPPMGDTVPRQFMREWMGLNLDGCCFYYHGAHRGRNLEKWRERVSSMPSTQVCFMLTSSQTLHGDVRGILKESPGTSIEKARTTMAKRLGFFNGFMRDEFQEDRNGGCPTDEKKDIDPSKAFYNAIDAVLKLSIRNRTMSIVLGLTATPCVNSSGDLYSFLRWFWNGEKSAIMNSTRKSKDKQQRARFRAAGQQIMASYIVTIDCPPVPETTRGTISHTLTTHELSMMTSAMIDLSGHATRFLQALIKYKEHPFADSARIQMERMKAFFLSSYTLCRRGVLHPYFYEPPERADPSVKPLKDSRGNVVMRINNDGVQVPIGAKLKIKAKEVAAKYPPGRKFESILTYLSTISDERVLIQCAYSDACDLLAEYIHRRFPTRDVYLYHGNVSGRANHMERFQAGAPDAILLATRGACEQAVDVSATTTKHEFDAALGYAVPRRYAVRQIFLDVALSSAAQQQAEGRTKRTIAQGVPEDPDQVRKWICENSRAVNDDNFPTIETFMQMVVDLKKARCEDIFRTVDDDIEAGTENAGASTDLTHDTEKGVLVTLIELMSPHMKTKDGNGKKRATVHTQNNAPDKRVRM
tara:strand:+ start:2860 stop:4893 length:2034 start_codon:yes stop_codon:yes gene_type:complete